MSVRTSKKIEAVPVVQPSQSLANFEDVRTYLGVSRSTLLRLIYARKITAIKLGATWRFRWADVERFVEKRTQVAA